MGHKFILQEMQHRAENLVWDSVITLVFDGRVRAKYKGVLFA